MLDPGGKRIRRSTGTADEKSAQEFHDRLKGDLWRITRLDEKAVRSFNEAALRWLKEKSHKRSIHGDKIKLRKLRPFFEKIKLHQITGEHCRSAVNEATQASSSTKNRYLALLRAILRMAEKEWTWIDKAPHVSLYKEKKRRIRWLRPVEAQRLIGFLPPHLVPIVRFALATGLRKTNIYSLRWDQIDMQRHVAWVHPDEAKAGRAIGIPLNQTAIDALRSQIGKHHEVVFTYRGKPIKGASNVGFYKACDLAGIKDFRFHDLRHTWASWLIQSGVGLAELQELGGWESVEMVRRYAHLAPDHLHKHSKHIDDVMSYSCHTPDLEKEKQVA
ncbi:tyrosine-type recombinase/integrase [Chitinimonas arctica]|uniref:tyrosine-type recombinase/integrase n=1 Tax=Chitinimonas arctica TaxID=2594795 RepID=UPI0035715D8C